MTIENTTADRLDYTLAGSLKNPFSEKGGENRYERRGACHLLHLLDKGHDPEDFDYGDLTLGTMVEDQNALSYQEYWFRGTWFDNIGVFWKEFTSPGRLEKPPL